MNICLSTHPVHSWTNNFINTNEWTNTYKHQTLHPSTAAPNHQDRPQTRHQTDAFETRPWRVRTLARQRRVKILTRRDLDAYNMDFDQVCGPTGDENKWLLILLRRRSPIRAISNLAGWFHAGKRKHMEFQWFSKDFPFTVRSCVHFGHWVAPRCLCYGRHSFAFGMRKHKET